MRDKTEPNNLPKIARMKIASVSKTKNQLSALIEQVRQGEVLVITDDDRPVARITAITYENEGDGTDA